jgi:hypothetical protein
VSTKISMNSPSGSIARTISRSARNGRDERGDDDQAGIGHQLRHFADAADILDPVGLGESQILVEAVAHIVAIEQEGVPVHPVQLLLDQVGDGRFARTRQAGEPQHAGFWFLSRVRVAADVERLPVDVLRAAQAKCSMPAATVALVILSIRMNPPSVRLSRRPRTRSACRCSSATPIAFSSSVLAARCSIVLTLTTILGLLHRRRHHLRAELQPIGAARHAALVGHPDERRFELVGDFRRIVGGRDDIAARAIDFVGKASA